MKLRISGQNLRFRVSRGEVARLQAGHALEDSIAFGPGEDSTLCYRVIPDASPAATLCAEFAPGAINVRVPASTIEPWAGGPELGLTGEMSWHSGSLTVLVEKDLQRLNPKAGEAEGDVYPHPLFGKKRCDHA